MLTFTDSAGNEIGDVENDPHEINPGSDIIDGDDKRITGVDSPNANKKN